MIESSKLTSERIKEYLNNGKRFDGRKQDEFREIKIECGISKKAEGSAKVKLGDTEVWAGVKMSISEPYEDSPEKGNLMVTAELLPLSNSKFEYGSPKFEAIELGRLVDRGIRESKFIDLDKLCIKKGEKVWNIFVDVYSINDDGNLLDAAFIAAVAALKQAKIPVYDEKEDKIDYEKESKTKLYLTNNFPINFNVYKIGDKILFDAKYEEEEASEGRLTVGTIPGKPFSICSMQKSQLMNLTPEKFSEMLDMVEKKYDKFYSEIVKKIEDAVKSAEKKK